MNKIFYSTACSILLLLTPLAHAFPPQQPQGTTPEKAPQTIKKQQTDPVNSIKTTLDKLEKFSGDTEKASPIILRSFIENEIIPHFSFEEMSRWITGPYARRMTLQEREDFLQRLKEAFLNSMANHLGNLKNIKERVRFYPTRYRGFNEAIVGSKVYRDSSYPAKLEFRMRRMGADWKIVDVRANGTSAVVYYRQHFISELRQYNKPAANRNYN